MKNLLLPTLLLALGLPARADRTAALLDPSSPAALQQVKPTSDNVTVAAGMEIKISPGPAGYPGVSVVPAEGKVFDLSAFGHIQAQVTNTGPAPVGLTLRADNEGNWKDNPWNAEVVRLKPGASGQVKLYFGHSFGGKPGYALKPAAVSKILLFVGKSDAGQSFRIDSLEAGGTPGEKPPVDPKSIRVLPKEGYLYGGGVPLDPARQVTVREGAHAALAEDGKSLHVTFGQAGQSVAIKPPEGLWNLNSAHQVRVRLTNLGTAPARPAVRIDSAPGATDAARPAAPLEPGASAEIVASFLPSVPARIEGAEKPRPAPGTGTKFTSDAVASVTLLADEAGGTQKFAVESLVADAPPVAVPDWLGKKPPVEGDWVQTFSEEFAGNEIDASRWNIYTSNFWDKRTHFSKNNVIVSDGVVRLRTEKRTGRHNDDPAGKETPYATGFLDTYGKWVQRYGYFEARMKLPKAPGLWPAFWLMPDRGVAAGEQWQRADTANGGMEFDIMEFLSRWGVYRFTTAFHWDGYGKNHKATGATVYTGHDREGYVTTGLLWLPGLAVIYNNGREVARWESDRISTVPSDIMFTAVTGGWDNSPLDDAQLPDELVIDYVRCWQRRDLASAADTTPLKP